MQLSRGVLDEGTLESLRELQPDGGADFLAQLTTVFIEDGSTRLADLRAGVDACEDVRVRRAAHSLKGMSAALGATEMAGLCSRLERQVATASIDRALAERIEVEFTRVAGALHSLI